MKKKIVISYWWECEKMKKISGALKEALEKSAESNIFEMMAEGYVEGELLCNVDIDVDGFETPEDGWTCRGWWKIKKN